MNTPRSLTHFAGPYPRVRLSFRTYHQDLFIPGVSQQPRVKPRTFRVEKGGEGKWATLKSGGHSGYKFCLHPPPFFPLALVPS